MCFVRYVCIFISLFCYCSLEYVDFVLRLGLISLDHATAKTKSRQDVQLGPDLTDFVIALLWQC